MSGQEILKASEDKMSKILASFQEELKTIRTGKANPDIFKRVRVECYGTNMSLQEVAGVTAPDGRSFVIQPFDKTNLKAIEQAIQNSELGLNPTNDGSIIRIVVPPLSEDRRKELVKQVSKITEDKGKVPTRNIRRDSNDQLKKLKGSISDDELSNHQDELEKITSKYINLVDEAFNKKKVELTTV
ncbi:MAG: ribosome recycling factor [Candidatus Caenarcaniphilales bacterium]|nr:ribosome recycling factor [Candidatus Caenarcaniphilales bacterium]